MKIALLSGADKNAGDFLIVHRSKLLLERFVGDCDIVQFPRNKPLDNRLDELNACDVVVFAGGPGYVPDMYPGRFPLVDDLAKIAPPFFALGMGGFTPTSNIGGIEFNPSSRELLDRFEADGFGFGCRDGLTKRLLESNGYVSTVFTGCPAWYDLGKVDADRLLVEPKRNEIRNIAVSDPAILRNIDAPRHLIAELQGAFPSAKIKLVFHRGWNEDAYTDHDLARAQASLADWARANGVEPVDIAYSHAGFAEYDRCDLHVGYRVHAHLYNVSQRKPSYLIEEDGRGYGANEAFGCQSHISLGSPGIAMRAASKLLRRGGAKVFFGRGLFKESAKKTIAHVADDIERGYPEANCACRTSSETFVHMKEHVLRLNESTMVSYGDLVASSTSFGERKRQ